MKICPNCGETENPKIAKFCRSCRYEFREKKSPLKPILTGTIVLALLGGILFFLYPHLTPSKHTDSEKIVDENNEIINSQDNSDASTSEEESNDTAKNNDTTKATENNKEKQSTQSTDAKVNSETKKTNKVEEPVVAEIQNQPQIVTKTYSIGTYTGSMVSGQRHGEGVFAWNNGDRYEGNFVNNKMSGRGVLYSKNRKFRYEGYFSNDDFNGQGVYYHDDGWRHEGVFKNGQPHGEGTHYNAKGKAKKGIWENGEYKSSVK